MKTREEFYQLVEDVSVSRYYAILGNLDLGDMVRKGAALMAAYEEMAEEIDRLKGEYNDENVQFNEGFDAYNSGVLADNQPTYRDDYDTWLMGWAWAKYCKEVEE